MYTTDILIAGAIICTPSIQENVNTTMPKYKFFKYLLLHSLGFHIPRCTGQNINLSTDRVVQHQQYRL